jgi:TPR repeat protein/formylglycine-generating enzyme required for sulfatase activity
MNEQGMVVKRLVVLTLLMVVLAVAQASAAKRVALVIGNSAYQHTAKLSNPRNDALLISRTLRKLGFSVIEKTDLTQRDMKFAITEFGEKLEQAGSDAVGLFYYAGHGIQANGVNYLIPVDAKLDKRSHLDVFGVNANWVLGQMEAAKNPVNLMFLDACRDNPFGRSWTRGITNGLARMDAPRGSKIAYATRPGKIAIDGKGANSPYTSALAKTMVKPGLTLNDVFIKTRNLVMASTKGKQVPWEEGGLTSRFYFIPPLPKSPLVSTPSADIAYWYSVKDSKDIKAIKTYLSKFPKGVFVDLARVKIRELERQKGLTIASLTPPTTLIEEMDETYVAVKIANLREKPSAKSRKVGRVEIDIGLKVTGKVRGKNWYRVTHGGDTAFVFVPLVKAIDGSELEAWKRVRNKLDAKNFEDFLKAHPSGHFADRARRLKEALEPVQVAIITPTKPTVPSQVKPAVVAPPKPTIPSTVKPAVGIYSKRFKLGDTFKDCPECPEMVVIPTAPKPIAIGKFEVTQTEWRIIIGWNPSHFVGSRNPVENVRFDDTQDFLEVLRAETGKKYRLLTEDEWETAARAGTRTVYQCGNDVGCLDSVGWYNGNSDGRTHPVGSKEANAFGLYDMHGNVWEWVKSRVLRGGSWINGPEDVGPYARNAGTYSGGGQPYAGGFRIARDLDEGELRASNTNRPKQVSVVSPPAIKTQSSRDLSQSNDVYICYGARNRNPDYIAEAKRRSLSCSEDAHVALSRGLEAFKKQQYEDAYGWYHKAALKGNTVAQVRIGGMLVKGQGVNKSYEEAANWYRKAAAQGNTAGQLNLGEMYFFGHGLDKNINQAINWFSKAAAKGNAASQTYLGMIYLKGEGAWVDYDKALKWVRKAANQNFAGAQFLLGHMYYEGFGVNSDYNEAHKWFLKAANQNFPNAQNAIGYMYKNGEGVESNDKEAEKWYRKAAEQGLDVAKQNLKNLLDR